MVQTTCVKRLCTFSVVMVKYIHACCHGYRGEFNLEKAVERFAAYDSWGKMEYQFSVQVR